MYTKKWFRTFLAIFPLQKGDATALFKRLPEPLQSLIRIVIVWHTDTTFLWIQGNRNLRPESITLGEVQPLMCDPVRFVYNYDRIFFSKTDFQVSYHIGTVFQKGKREKPKISEALERLRLFASNAE